MGKRFCVETILSASMWFHNSIIGERFTKYLTNFRKKWKINHEFPFFYYFESNETEVLSVTSKYLAS